MYKHVQTYSGEMILTRCTVDVLLCCVGSVRFLAMSQAAAAATGTKPVSTYFVAKTKKTGATQTGTDATAAVPMEVDDVAVTSTAPASSGSVGGNGGGGGDDPQAKRLKLSSISLLPADIGLAGIVMDPAGGDASMYVKQGVKEKDVRLTFMGRVSRVPRPHSLKVCDVWGQSYYIDGSGFNNKDCELFFPAWLVDAAPKTIGANASVMMHVTETFEFTFDYFLYGKHEVENIELTTASVQTNLQSKRLPTQSMSNLEHCN